MEMMRLGRRRIAVEASLTVLFLLLVCYAVLPGGKFQGRRWIVASSTAGEDRAPRRAERGLGLGGDGGRTTIDAGRPLEKVKKKLGTPVVGLKPKLPQGFRRPVKSSPKVLETVDFRAETGYLWQPQAMNGFQCPAGEGTECDATVTYCLISIGAYQENPWKFPMAAMLQKKSECSKPERSRAYRLSTLRAYVREHQDEFLQPTGFVYHETRTGSTLVANMLAHVPSNLVISENSLAEDPARRCPSCSPEQRTLMLRDVLTLMGSTMAGHTHLFFKFQDSTTLGEMIKAFPDVSWVYLFRDPVEVMVSNLKGAYGKRDRFYEEGFDYEAADNSTATDAIERPGHKSSKPMLSPCLLGGVVRGKTKEMACASRLMTLCLSAVEALRAERAALEGGDALLGKGRGALVEYTNLPDAVTSYIYPKLFGMGEELLEQHLPYISQAAEMYSKSMSNPESKFELGTDAHYKHVMSERAYREAADSTGLSGLYQTMQEMQAWRKGGA